MTQSLLIVTSVPGEAEAIGTPEGARVVVAARRQDLLNQVVEQITGRGGVAIAIQTDVKDEAQVEGLIEETVKQ